MTDPQALPPGWYDDRSGSGRLRWWDGIAWTEHLAPVSAPAAPYTGVRFRRVPEGARLGTVWIWLLVILDALVILGQLLLPLGYLTPSTLADPLLLYTAPLYLAGLGIGVVMWLGGAVLALADQRELAVRGVDRPFPWPWAFLGTVVYVIGRTVVLRRRGADRVWAPLVVWIVGYVTAMVVGIAAITVALIPFLSEIARLTDRS